MPRIFGKNSFGQANNSFFFRKIQKGWIYRLFFIHFFAFDCVDWCQGFGALLAHHFFALFPHIGKDLNQYKNWKMSVLFHGTMNTKHTYFGFKIYCHIPLYMCNVTGAYVKLSEKKRYSAIRLCWILFQETELEEMYQIHRISRLVIEIVVVFHRIINHVVQRECRHWCSLYSLL